MSRWSVPLKGARLQSKLYPHLVDCAAVPVGDKVHTFAWFTKRNLKHNVFNTVSLRWMKLSPMTKLINKVFSKLKQTAGRECPSVVPSKRYGPTAVLVEDVIYIWGGIVNCEVAFCCTDCCYYDGGTIKGAYCDSVLYAFDVDTHKWFQPKVSGTVPEARHHHSACVLGNVMFIHGGVKQDLWTNDMYKLDTTTMVWSLINTRGTPAPASAYHSANIIGTNMFVFGGYSDPRVFDTETNCWLNTPYAQQKLNLANSATAFAYKGGLYIHAFGGEYGMDSDLRKFNPETFSWKKVEAMGEGPAAMKCYKPYMCSCMVGDRLIVFGYTTHKKPIMLQLLHLSPTLKTLCELAVIEYGLEKSGLPHNIRWELAAMASDRKSYTPLIHYIHMSEVD